MAAATRRVDAAEVVTDVPEASAAGTDGIPPAAGAAAAARDKPVCLIVLGMAGSGKTTFVQVRRLRRLTVANCARLRRMSTKRRGGDFWRKQITCNWFILVIMNFNRSTKHLQVLVVQFTT